MPPESYPVLRAAFEATGSGGWIMASMLERKLDRANGFRLDLGLGDDRVQGGLQATEARLAAGAVDVIDTDWLSVARCRRQGLAIAAVAPYGAIFGGLVAPRDGALHSLADLPGRRIGVIHASDKNWLLLRAACRKLHGFDPEASCRRIDAGSKTRLRQLLLDGEVDGALLFWHQVPALTADGAFAEICDLLELLPAIDARVMPSSFFVLSDTMLDRQPAVVHGFCRAVAAAIAALRQDASAWQRLANVGDAVAPALRSKWLARVGLAWKAGMAGELGELAAQLTSQVLDAGTFAMEYLQEQPS